MKDQDDGSGYWEVVAFAAGPNRGKYQVVNVKTGQPTSPLFASEAEGLAWCGYWQEAVWQEQAKGEAQ